jgi:hypothetical protein
MLLFTRQSDSPTLFFTTDVHEKFLVVKFEKWVTGKFFFLKFISGFPGAGALGTWQLTVLSF